MTDLKERVKDALADASKFGYLDTKEIQLISDQAQEIERQEKRIAELEEAKVICDTFNNHDKLKAENEALKSALNEVITLESRGVDMKNWITQILSNIEKE